MPGNQCIISLDNKSVWEDEPPSAGCLVNMDSTRSMESKLGGPGIGVSK